VNLKIVVGRKLKVAYCPNTNITYRYKPRILLGKSKICDGLGIFAGQHFKKNDFIGEYVGEVISKEEGEKREIVFDAINMSYIFNLTKTEHLDSYFIGNKLRFANHDSCGFENAYPSYMFLLGQTRIAFYAKRAIKAGDEILFNYGADYQLKWLLEFNEKRKKDSREKKKSYKHKKIDLFKEDQENNNVPNVDSLKIDKIRIFSDLEETTENDDANNGQEFYVDV